MTKQTIGMAVLGAILLTPECLSKTITLSVDWDQARATWEHGDFRASVKVRLRSSEQVRGKLAGITDSGLRIQKRQTETVIPRDQIRMIRLVPRRASSWNKRILAIGGGIPVGLLAAYGGLAICGDIDADSTCNKTVPYLTWGAAQYLLFRLGAKADRGALILLLPATAPAAANSDLDAPSTTPAERP